MASWRYERLQLPLEVPLNGRVCRQDVIDGRIGLVQVTSLSVRVIGAPDEPEPQRLLSLVGPGLRIRRPKIGLTITSRSLTPTACWERTTGQRPSIAPLSPSMAIW